MSTETTNKKIKIDNGTTFGRTYTDKAVDELLKNVGGGGISVIELTDKNGTIASAQLGKINANPQNFAFKYDGKILLFARASSTTYQYCNNNTTSSDNNVMTTSTLLTIESSTGVYTIAENVHNVVANSIHPANGGDLTNIQIGSKVYSIPSGGSGNEIKDGALQEKALTISITDILTDNNKIQELFSKMTSTDEQSALIMFDNQISYDTYKDYDTIKLDLSPLSSMGVSGYYILRNQSHLNSFTAVYSLTTVGFSISNNNLDKLVIKNLIIAGNDEVNSPLNKFLLKIL